MIAIIGMGFMGRTHAAAFDAASRDGYPVSVRGYLSLDSGSAPSAPVPAYRRYPDLDALLGDAAVRAVSICTPTDTHVALATRAIAAGKHVLVEKPVALEPAAILALRDQAAREGCLVVPAFCMRFWPGWLWLRDHVRAGTFGPTVAGTFTRVGAAPDWSGFYRDEERSGNALFDLHIHDADFVRWCWGRPVAVVSHGSARHLVTGYRFPDGPSPIAAEGGWLGPAAVPFRMRYTVELADAVVDFDLGREPAVLLHRARATEAVSFPPASAYELQARHFLDLLLGRTDEPVATLDDAWEVTRILLAERESLRCGTAVAVPVAGGADAP